MSTTDYDDAFLEKYGYYPTVPLTPKIDITEAYSGGFTIDKLKSWQINDDGTMTIIDDPLNPARDDGFKPDEARDDIMDITRRMFG